MRQLFVPIAALGAALLVHVNLGNAQSRSDDGGIAGGCTPSLGPDVIVGDLSGITKWGAVSGVSGYSIGTTSCNQGNENLLWQATNPNHPVIAQNIYRLKDGRFEQIGMGWLKHGFTALTQNLCCTCNGQGGAVLGVGCSDPYGSSLNGDQNGFACGGAPPGICGGLGPRFEVNATSGVFSFPYFSAGQSGDVIYKRIQIDNDDLDPALNPGALYYAEGQYVTPDDSAAANHHNNASYEQALVGSFSNGGWTLSLTGSTERELPAIYAWQDNDPDVMISVIDDFGRGRAHLGYRVTDNGDGTWHYEYALHNLNSHRSIRELIIPVGENVILSNVAFKDIHYHSGDGPGGVNYDGTDWAVSIGGSQISWSTETEAQNASANALRWGTLYNFRFDASTPPQNVTATIGLYRIATPQEVTTNAVGPSDGVCPWDCSDGDGAVTTVDLLDLLSQWGQVGACDVDGGGVTTTDLLDVLANWGPCP